MLKIFTKLLAASALFATLTLALAALPSTKDVEAAMRAQNWQQAETMLLEVTSAKPSNSKAWYLLAQAEEKQGKFGSAQQDLLRAEKLDPSLSFASPGQVPALEQRLAHETKTQAPLHAPTAQTQSISHFQPAQQHSDMGWGLALLGFAFIVFIALIIYWVWHMFTGPSRTVGYGGYGGYGGGGGGGVGGSTVVVNNSGGSNLLSTMILADALRDDHHHDHYRDDSYSSAPAQSNSDWDSGSSSSSSVDLGGSSGGWDSGSSSSSSYDSGSSTSSGSDW